jgi:hypothetical protein
MLAVQTPVKSDLAVKASPVFIVEVFSHELDPEDGAPMETRTIEVNSAETEAEAIYNVFTYHLDHPERYYCVSCNERGHYDEF